MNPVEAYLRENIARHHLDLLQSAAIALRITEPEVEVELRRLLERGEFEAYRDGENRAWRWKPVLHTKVQPGMDEERIWSQWVAPRVADAPENVQRILRYGTTEMLNNVFDHSEAKEVVIVVRNLPQEIEVYIEDDGVGIFEKIQREKRLDDPRHAAVELFKGKLTTDPSRHTGQGIFFTARMCDKFLIWSGATACGQTDDGAWQVVARAPRPGTTIRMAVNRNSSVTPKQVFDEFFPLGPDDDFAKTWIHVSLLEHASDGLVSRSQAKRLLARCDQFREVVFDFDGISSIGPAFADEIFRVFALGHLDVRVREVNANADVMHMIAVARKPARSSD